MVLIAHKGASDIVLPVEPSGETNGTIEARESQEQSLSFGVQPFSEAQYLLKDL